MKETPHRMSGRIRYNSFNLTDYEDHDSTARIEYRRDSNRSIDSKITFAVILFLLLAFFFVMRKRCRRNFIIGVTNENHTVGNVKKKSQKVIDHSLVTKASFISLYSKNTTLNGVKLVLSVYFYFFLQ